MGNGGDEIVAWAKAELAAAASCRASKLGERIQQGYETESIERGFSFYFQREEMQASKTERKTEEYKERKKERKKGRQKKCTQTRKIDRQNRGGGGGLF